MVSPILRVCASCEWIFKTTERDEEGFAGESPFTCPKCGFGSYGARSVYGDSCYRLAKTQENWKSRKLDRYEHDLDEEIKKCKT